MKPGQMVLIMAAGLAVVYFMSRKKPVLAGAVGNQAIGNQGALASMRAGYEWTAAQNKTLADQVATLTNERDTFRTAYEWAAAR